MIRGNQPNQDYFGRVFAPLEPPKQVLVILLMSMINEKQPFELRCAVLYCFQAYLHRNELAQAQVIETLLPADNEGKFFLFLMLFSVINVFIFVK